MERTHLDGEQMAERGRMGVREEVERRTGTAGAQRGRERATEKKVGKHKLNEVETTIVQVWQGTRSRRVPNRLYKNY